MPTRQPGRNALDVAILVVGSLGVVVSVLAAAEGIDLYRRHNAAHCGGGFGWLFPVFMLYATLVLALLATLVALVFALVVAIRGQRWAWVVGLVTATAACVLIAASSNSQASHTLVGSALGFGCSWFYPEAAQPIVPLLVAVPTLAFLIVRRRRGK